MTDYNGHVHCGEVFRSSKLSNEKPYLFKCIQCQDIFQQEAFLTHFEQNLCELREITIKEEVFDNGCLSVGPAEDETEGINSNSIDEIEDSIVFKKDDDVSNADEKYHVRYKIESSDAEVDAEPQEFKTDVSLDDDFDLDAEKYDSEDSNVTDETEYLVKRNQGNEEETISNFIENDDNVMALIEAYKAQTVLWNKRTSYAKHRRKYLKIVTKELNQKRKLHLHWKQVSTLIRHLLRKYRDDLKQFKDSQKQKTTYRPVWFSEHMQFLQNICQECGRKFLRYTEMKIHMRIHTKAKPFCCEICGMSFRHTQSLRDHKRRHTKNYLHTCELCSKGFYNKAKLNIHFKVHTNVRDCICKTCGKAFRTTQNLRRHEVTHSDVRKYVCSICSKSFKLSYYLSKHMRIHGRNLRDDKMTTSEDK